MESAVFATASMCVCLFHMRVKKQSPVNVGSVLKKFKEQARPTGVQLGPERVVT